MNLFNERFGLFYESKEFNPAMDRRHTENVQRYWSYSFNCNTYIEGVERKDKYIHESNLL